MVDEAVNDLNMTISSDVVKHLNMGIDTEVQRMLIPVYEKVPFLSETFFGIPYANLLAASITFLFFLLLRRLFTSIVITFLLKLAEKSSFSYD
ncbi:MAG TPA: mechanosensitive ion channel family protein, partial [Epsilonproteobacteria bacterium]|nr:mechanosensitive ion channel family protein [Campylobacterota bacterium]